MTRLSSCRSAVVLALLLAGPTAAETIAFTHATLHPMNGPVLVDGTLLVENGLIVALGTDAVQPGGEATIVDLGGRDVWPGFIDAASDIGLTEIGAVRATDDSTELGELNADLRAEVAFHPDSRRLPPALAGGVLTAHVVPQGELVLGRSAAMRLAGWTWEEMTLAAPVAEAVGFPLQLLPTFGYNLPSQKEFDERKGELTRRLDEIFGAARGYDRARDAAESGEGPAIDLDPRYEALRPVISGELPLLVRATEKTQIDKALDWLDAQGLTRAVLLSGSDSALLAERLAAARIPVILQEVLRLPERNWEPYDAPFTAAARLVAAGVPIAFADGGDSSNARNLPFQAAMAVAFGLPREAALRALTLGAAEILGIDDRIGSLAPGKEATFFVASGDPLDVRSSIDEVWVRGRQVDLAANPQYRLWQRYRDRPAPASVGETTAGAPANR